MGYVFVIWGALLGLAVLQVLWCRLAAYPMAFEKNLKKGKTWVYIPLQWKGLYKLQILFLSRLLLFCEAVAGAALLAFYTRRHGLPWYLGFAAVFGLAAYKLNDWLLNAHYLRQEDCYYRMQDALRAKMEAEGKDTAGSAFNSLADYQYQNFLRKADEGGRLLEVLGEQSRKPRKRESAPAVEADVEAGAET